MDWERPKGLTASSNQAPDASGTTPTLNTAPISIWRTYFVANEWNEIQSLGKINYTLLLALVTFFIEVHTG